MKKSEKKTAKATKVPAKKVAKSVAPKAPYKSVKQFANLCLDAQKPRGAYLSMNVDTGLASFVSGTKKAPHAVAADIPVALEEIAKALGIKVVHVS